jgi:hypothetical protein
MDPTRRTGSRPSPSHTAAGIAVALVAVSIIAFVLYAVVNIPKPPPDGVISREQAESRIYYASNGYLKDLLHAAASGPLTEGRVRTLPPPRGTTFGFRNVSTNGTTTIVTFGLRKPYGNPKDGHQATGCFRLSVTSVESDPRSPIWSATQVSLSACQAPHRTEGSGR